MGDRRRSIGGVSSAGDQGSLPGTAVSGAAADAATTGALQGHCPQLHPRAGLLGEYPGIPPPAAVQVQQQHQAICRHPMDGCFGDHQPPAVNNVDWYMDSGASDHVTMDAGNLSALGSSWHDPTDSCIRVADGSRIPVVSAGSCHFPSATARGPLVLRHVLVAPRLVENLISVRRFTIDNNCSVEFDPYGYSIKDLLTQTLIARYDSPGEDRYLFSQAPPPTNAGGGAAPSNNKLAAATSHAAITCDQSGGGTELPSLCCRACQCQQLGEDARALERFDLVHCGICTSSVASAWGHKYSLFLVDDCSHFLWTFPLRLTSDIFPTLSQFFGYVRARFGVSVKRVQCDGCHDLAQLSARLFFLSNGVELRAPCPCNASPHRSIIRSANALAQSLLFKAGLSPLFWADALDTSTYLINRHPTAETLLGFYHTPYFALYGTHPTNSHLRAFGCACYPDASSISSTAAAAAAARHIQPPPASSLCVFLGYSEDRGYRCLDLASNRIVFSPSVAFIESWFPLLASSSSLPSTSNDPSRPVSSKDFNLLPSNDNDILGEH